MIGADELKEGSTVCVADNLFNLKSKFYKGKTATFKKILSEEHLQEKWIAYLFRSGNIFYLTSCTIENWETAKSCCGAKSKLFVGTEEEVNRWVAEHKNLASLIKDFEDGKKIEFYHTAYESWADVVTAPFWDTSTRYRVKPDEGLKWTDLKVGDIIKSKDGSQTAMVIRTNLDDKDSHINIGYWLRDDDLEKYWKKKED